MPIRINLLAEAQTAADQRRKDPVKRGIWIASFLVLVVILFIAKLQLDILFENGELTKATADWNAMTAKYNVVTGEQSQIGDVNHKLDKLAMLSTNRFLWAPALDTLQHTMVDQVQVTRIAAQQSVVKEDPKDIPGPPKIHIPGGMVQRVGLSIEARDYHSADQNYNKYKESLCTCDFFAKHLQRRDGFVLDGVLSALTVDPLNPNRQFVVFTLASHFPETRQSD
jgi:hypothetical protein